MAVQFYIPVYGTVAEDGSVTLHIDEDEFFPADWTWDEEDETWGGFPTDPQAMQDRARIVQALDSAIQAKRLVDHIQQYQTSRPVWLEQAADEGWLYTATGQKVEA